MRRIGPDIARWALVRLLLAGSVAYVLVYLIVAVARLSYPFELEWMEGGMSEHVGRILAGKPIYAKPSLEFVSFLYPPLYYLAGAAFTKVLGPGLPPLRLLSLLSSLGVLALIYRAVRREAGTTFPAVLAVGLFAATYDRVGSWFDLARLDSWYMLLLLASVYALRFHASAAGAILAGLLMGAAFLTKQSAVVVALPLAVYCLAADWRRAALFIGAAAIVMVGSSWLLDRWSGGWFGYYCFYLPSKHPRIEEGPLRFWTNDLLPALPIGVLAAATYVAGRLRPGSRERFFFPLFAAGMIGSSWSVRNMVGAELNNLLPAFAAVSMLAALAIGEALGREAEGGRWPRVARFGQALLVAQLAMLAYSPTKYLPSAADREAGTKLVNRIARIHGDVFVPHHGYLASRAGKRSFAHALAVDNLHVEDEGTARRDLEEEIVDALVRQRFAAVVLESDGWHAQEILVSYRIAEIVVDRPDVFWPVTGARLRPEALCVPR